MICFKNRKKEENGVRWEQCWWWWVFSLLSSRSVPLFFYGIRCDIPRMVFLLEPWAGQSLAKQLSSSNKAPTSWETKDSGKEILKLPNQHFVFLYKNTNLGINRYGSFFKSHLLGCPTLVSMDSEVNRYILKNESKGLVPGYPQSMLDILGTCNMAAVHGSSHRLMRGSLLSLISSNMMRDHILPKVDHFMRSYLGQWNDLENIDIQDKTKHVCVLSFSLFLLKRI